MRKRKGKGIKGLKEVGLVGWGRMDEDGRRKSGRKKQKSKG